MTIFKVTTVEKNEKTYTNIKLKRKDASEIGMGLKSEKFKFKLMGRPEYNIKEGVSNGKPYTIIAPLIKPLNYVDFFEKNGLLNEKGCKEITLPTSKAIEQAIRMSQQFETYEIGMKECSYVDHKDGKTKDTIMFTIDLVPEEEEQKEEPKAEKTSEEPVSNQVDNEEEFDIDF